MKVPFCLILFFVASLQDLSSQTTYFFLNSATDPSSVNSWTTDPSGVLLLSPPTDFTNPADVFNLDNSITLSSDWTVAGEVRVDVGISESGDPELDIGTLVVKSGGSLDLRIIDPRPVLDTLKIEVGGMVLTCNLEVSSSVVVNGLLHMASLCDITGSASFTLNAGAELKTNDPLNLTSNAGAIQVTGTRSYSSEADYTFRTSGLASYSTGDGLPSQVNNLEITFSNNDPSTVTLSQDVTVNGTFKLTNDPGTFDIGSNILVTNGTISFDDGATLGTSSGSAWTIAGTGPEVALPAMTLDGTITISRPNGARLDGVVNILGSMVLDGGDVDLNGEILNLGSSGLLNESAGNTVKGTSGTVFAQRMLNAPQAVNVAGMGITITSDADLGTTNISRAHAEQTVISNASMLRYFDVTPTNNSGLNADLVFSYDDSELNSLNEANIVLFRSTDGGTNWIQRGGTANAANNTISLSGIDAFSRWTASVPPVLFRVERSTGDVFTGGAFIPDGADLAEHIRVSEPVEAGDIVELDPDKPKHYRKARGQSQLIAGIITTKPGFTLGNEVIKKASPKVAERANKDLEEVALYQPKLALLGRVPVKATTENGPIRLGDLLTVSTKPGYAMRCGQAKECEGMVVGKALETLESGEGLILVLVMH